MENKRPYFQPESRFKWPDGKKCALILSFDIDGETTALSEDPKLEAQLTTMSQCTYGPNIGVPRILGLLEHYKVPASFFIPTFVMERHPKMTQTIHEAGHELGVHGHLHEKLRHLSQKEEEEILKKCLSIFNHTVGLKPIGYRAPWYENNTWTHDLLLDHGFIYNSSMMGDDVPFLHKNGLVEIPVQWMMEDWEQFAFNPDPHWGVIPEDCEKVYRLWWDEFIAMRDYGCCCVITMHPWLMGRPSRVKLLERIIRQALDMPEVWITTCQSVAEHLIHNPESRLEINLDAV